MHMRVHAQGVYPVFHHSGAWAGAGSRTGDIRFFAADGVGEGDGMDERAL